MLQEDGIYPPSFKATVALAALRGSQPIDELVERYALPMPLIQEWVSVLEEHAAAVFTLRLQAPTSHLDFFDSSELTKTIGETVELAKLAEEHQRQLNAFLDAAPVGIGMADATGKLILVNRAHRLLWGEDMALPENVGECREFKGWWADGTAHHGQPIQPEEWALTCALRGHEIDNDIVEIEPFDKPGTRKIISLSARPIRDNQGVVTGSVVAQVDITLQKRAEEALRQADRNKDEFIAVLAHELRNPLAPIRAAIDLFTMRKIDDPVLQRATSAMERQVSHITRLVDDLLDVARISRGKVELKQETCDIARIVEQTAGDYRPAIEANRVTLAIHVPAGSVWVNGDSTRLAQVIGNLLHNATKFTRQDNKISVRLHEESDANVRYGVITVEDNGAGMEAQLVPMLFNPFTQAAQGLGRGSGGLGLGLVLVKGLVDLHGGTVSAKSAGLGRGSTFTIRLPIAMPAREAVSIDHQRSEHGSLRIVAIDDNKDALEMLSLLLDIDGHEVTLAYDGTAGIDAVRAVNPDVVICDIGLPGQKNGYDVARAIRSDQDLADTLLIALSGYGKETDRQNSAAAGFNAHLVKPASYQELANLLKDIKLRRLVA